MKSTILAVILIVAAGAAHAQHPPGLAGNAGRMPETMSPGLQPPSSMPSPTPIAPIQRYSGPESNSQDRSESREYPMQDIQRESNGSWSAGATQYATPTQPEGVPSWITTYPDGRTVEERD